MARKTQLKVVSLERRVPEAPAELGEHGRRLWVAVHEQYDVVDAGGVETLRLACAALDRAERCRALIDEQGEMITVGKAIRSHPLLRDELANRAFVTRAIDRLGLDLEPINSLGRPPGSFKAKGG